MPRLVTTFLAVVAILWSPFPHVTRGPLEIFELLKTTSLPFLINGWIATFGEYLCIVLHIVQWFTPIFQFVHTHQSF